MNAHDRRQLRRSIFLGLLLTTATVAMDMAHWLNRIEWWFSDRRAQYCQYFAPRPTDKLVHLDIDDAALEETIGKWPWPREVQAQIIDELRISGAKALALDIMFPHPTRLMGGLRQTADSNPPPLAVSQAASPTTVASPEKETATVAATGDAPATAPSAAQAIDDPDAVFADSLKRFGRVTLAVSLDFLTATVPSTSQRALIPWFLQNLELTKEEVDTRLKAKGLLPSTSDEYFAALHEAAAERIAAEKPTTLDAYWAIRVHLLPTLSNYRNSVPERVLEREFWRYLAVAAMLRVMPEVPAGAPPLRTAIGEKPPLPQLSQAVWGLGCADNMPGDDGVIRSLPLWVSVRGRIVPQLGLSLTCAYLGCEINDVKITANSVTIPRPDGPPVVIPVTTLTSKSGERVGTLADIPFFGTDDWETMYDYPSHTSKAQHLPISAIWETVEFRQRLRANNHTADGAMIQLLSVFSPDKSDELKTKPPPPDDSAARLEVIRATLDDSLIKQTIETYKGQSAKEKQADPNRDTMEMVSSIWEQLPALARQTELLRQNLRQRESALAKDLGGKAVLIGWTATGNIDFVPTPLHSRSPGVIVHGAIFNAIMTNWLFTRTPRWVNYALAALIGFIAIGITSTLSPWKALFAILLLLGGYATINGEVLYDHGHRIVGLAGPVVAGMLVWSHLTAARFIAEATEHSRIRKRFSSYKDPALVNYIIEHPEQARLDGQVREMTVAFTDLAGFTALSETLREKAVRIVGRYMTRMVPIIRKHRGVINSFMGDGIMFSYGAPEENPNHSADAAATVVEMSVAMVEFNAELVAEGYPPLHMRAGVNTGDVIVGDTGPEDASDYTCLGNVTNTAARLESANKYTGTKNLVSARTVELLGGGFVLRPVARLQVAGKKVGVMVYEVLSPDDKATDEHRHLAQLTQTMFDHYIAARFPDCIAAADALDGAFGESKLAALYREHCEEYLKTPLDEFVGNIVLEKK